MATRKLNPNAVRTPKSTKPVSNPTNKPKVPPSSSNQGYDEKTAQSDTDRDLGLGDKYGQGIADKYFTQDDLNNSRVDASRTPESSDYLSHLKNTMDSSGQRTGEQSDYLGGLNQRAAQVSQISPEQQQALNQMNMRAQTIGQQTPQMSQYLAKQMQIADNGYTSPQFQALYENTMANNNQQNATDNYNASVNAANGGVRGAAATAQANQLAQQQAINKNALNQGLAVKGMEYQTNALNQYGTSLGADETNRNNAANTASSVYGNTLNTATNNAATAGNAAYSEYGNQMGKVNDQNFTQGQTANNAYGQQLGVDQTDELNKQKYNNDQTANWRAGRMGAQVGGTGAYLGALQNSRANQVANNSIQFARQNYKNG